MKQSSHDARTVESPRGGRRKIRLVWVVPALLAACVLWPVSTVVSGRTRLRFIADDVPLNHVAVTQHWGVYGYRERPRVETRDTDELGVVEFPPRKSTGILGWRVARRWWVFLEQSVWAAVLGGPAPTTKIGTPGTFTERWGPIVGFDAKLPPGPWSPAPPAQGSANDYGFNLADGPDRYIYLRNVNPLSRQPEFTAYISGNARAFLGDTDVVLRLKRSP